MVKSVSSTARGAVKDRHAHLKERVRVGFRVENVHVQPSAPIEDGYLLSRRSAYYLVRNLGKFIVRPHDHWNEIKLNGHIAL